LHAASRRTSIARRAWPLVTLVALPAHACWDDAATRYNVSSRLLHAIAHVESAMDARAVGRNADGSRDLGLMQINSRWLPQLSRHGIEEHDLFEPCTNIHVGAWILADNVARLGYTWEAVGAYNAASPARRDAYIQKIRRQLDASAADPIPGGRTPASTAVRSNFTQLPTRGRQP
jgi:soluble lytic murein transglycosylase-like protein